VTNLLLFFSVDAVVFYVFKPAHVFALALAFAVRSPLLAQPIAR
jgi:hypothetical protein